MGALPRLAVDESVGESCSVARKAEEIKSIAIELGDTMDALYEKVEGAAGIASLVKRILYTVEGLADEIMIDERTREQKEQAVAPAEKLKKAKAVRQ